MGSTFTWQMARGLPSSDLNVTWPGKATWEQNVEKVEVNVILALIKCMVIPRVKRLGLDLKDIKTRILHGVHFN